MAAWRSSSGVGRTNDERSYSTPDPVSSRMGDRLRRANHLSMQPVTQANYQSPTLRETEMNTGQSAVMLCGWQYRQDASFHL